MGLFARESRDLTYQQAWASGDTVSSEGKAYNGLDALKLSVVVACVGLRSNLIAQLPLGAYRNTGAGAAPVTPDPLLLRKPSPRLPGPSLWLQQCSISRDLWGNAYGAIVGRDAALYPTAIEWLPPWQVTPYEDSLGSPVRITLQGHPYPTDDLVHVPGMVLPGSAIGIPPLAKAGLVDLATQAQDFGRNWFASGAVPSAVLYTDKELDETQANAYRDRMAMNWRKRRPAVLGRGFKFEQVQVSANESQFIETIRAAQVDVCMAFLVPPEDLGIAQSGSSVTYANREQRQQQHLINSMNMDLVTLQEVLTNLLPRPQFVRFNTAALLRTDFVQRAAAYVALVNAGIIVPDEARGFEDWAPLPNGAGASPRPPAVGGSPNPNPQVGQPGARNDPSTGLALVGQSDPVEATS